MATAAQLKGKRIKAKIRFTHIRYPKSGHQPGDFAIVGFKITEWLEGEMPDEFKHDDEALIDEPLMAKGNMPAIDTELDYTMVGTIDVDPKWGPQVKAERVNLDFEIKTPESVRKFLSWSLTERVIDLLFDKFPDPLEVIKAHDTKALVEVKGIGPATAERICRKYEETKDYGRAYVELQELGLTQLAISKIAKRYGSVDVMVDKIKQNPYILIKEVKGYGWNKADALAQKQGLLPNCKERVIAYARYYLEAQADANGDSWIMVDHLLAEIMAICSTPEHPLKKEDLYAWIKENMCGIDEFNHYASLEGWLRKKEPELPFLFYDTEQRRVGLSSIRLLEYDIAYHLRRIKEGEATVHCSDYDIDQAIAEAEYGQGFKYTDEQKAAIYKIIGSNVSILTGLGGTGKSTLLNGVVKFCQRKGLRIEQCALSGRASSKLSEITGADGKTIHRLLIWDPENDRFKRNEDNPIPADVIILDETSMVGGELFLSLVRAIGPKTKFIMVGDHHQLEAIGLCNVFKDCLNSAGYIPSVVLTKIHRQAAKSGIIVQSIKASGGEKMVDSNFIGEEYRGELKDFKIVCSLDTGFTQYNVIQEYKKLLATGVGVDNIQVIVAQRLNGHISCLALNAELQKIANPGVGPKDITVKCVEGDREYYVTYKRGDRVIVLKNNYRALTKYGEKVAIYNGNVGYIKDLDSESMTIHLSQQGDVIIPRADWYDIGLAYAITCHKKQGDQVPYAIVAIDNTNFAMFSKEWVYTALTRASKYCVLVTQPSAINKAVKVSRVRKKKTWLQEFLMSFEMEGHRP